MIEEIIVEGPNKVFVADITYVRIIEGFAYLFLVTDLYSRKIVGWYLSKNLSVEGALEALQMAMSEVRDSWRLIHHSDRGIQYCCNEYVKLLQSNKIRISMGESGNPYDNAVAERVNGILKSEFYLSVTFNSFEDARQAAEDHWFYPEFTERRKARERRDGSLDGIYKKHDLSCLYLLRPSC